MISHLGGVLLRVIGEGLRPVLDRGLPAGQAGFRRGRGAGGQISSVRRVLEGCTEFSGKIYFCFIGCAGAFGCVRRGALWGALLGVGVPAHFVRLMGDLCDGRRACVRAGRGGSGWFGVGRGVGRGCVLSPTLFGLCAECIVRRVLEGWNGGLSVGGCGLGGLRCAGDAALVVAGALGLGELLLIVKAGGGALGLRLGVSETGIMIVGGGGSGDPIVVDGAEVEHVTQFDFLGSLVAAGGGCSAGLRGRVVVAGSAVVGLNKIWTDRGIARAAKERLVSALVFPVAACGCGSWTLAEADRSGIASFEVWCWRRVLRVSWFVKRSGIGVLEGMQPGGRLLSHVRGRMVKCFGHVAGRGGGSLGKVIMQGCIEGREDLEPDGSTKSNLWSDAPFVSFTALSRIVRGGVMLLQSQAVSHDRTVPTDRPSL